MQATDTDMARVIGRQIKQARMRAAITIEQLAEAIGVHPVTITRWEGGERSPSVTVLARIAQITGVEPGSLLASDGDPTPQVPEDVAEVLALLGKMDVVTRAKAIKVLRALVDEP